jgi:hypothetical protein
MWREGVVIVKKRLTEARLFWALKIGILQPIHNQPITFSPTGSNSPKRPSRGQEAGKAFGFSSWMRGLYLLADQSGTAPHVVYHCFSGNKTGGLHGY